MVRFSKFYYTGCDQDYGKLMQTTWLNKSYSIGHMDQGLARRASAQRGASGFEDWNLDRKVRPRSWRRGHMRPELSTGGLAHAEAHRKSGIGYSTHQNNASFKTPIEVTPIEGRETRRVSCGRKTSWWGNRRTSRHPKNKELDRA